MARESQGLQVVLIVFVMLSVVLGVSLYIYVKEADTAAKAVSTEKRDRQQAESEKKATEEEIKVLKSMIGLPDKGIAEIKKQFDEDMQTYGNQKKPDAATDTASAGTLSYIRLLAGMSKVIQDRTEELVRTKALVADLQEKFKDREAAKDAQIRALVADYGKLDNLAHHITGDYKTAQQATKEEIAEFLKAMDAVKKNAMDALAKADENEKALKKELQEKDKRITELMEKVRKLEGPEIVDVPAGEITAVSTANKLVSINRGRADALPLQTKFTVYSAGSADLAKAVKKGTVEVTRIDGEHSAEARILDDKIADPIMVGDKLFTRFWSPGQQIHFALTGIMNVDGDGRNQLNIIRELINHNGGTVDCWLDEKGHKQGQITADTRYIVVGDTPERGSPESLKNHGDILRDAERSQLHKMTLGDLKQQMGH